MEKTESIESLLWRGEGGVTVLWCRTNADGLLVLDTHPSGASMTAEAARELAGYLLRYASRNPARDGMPSEASRLDRLETRQSALEAEVAWLRSLTTRTVDAVDKLVSVLARVAEAEIAPQPPPPEPSPPEKTPVLQEIQLTVAEVKQVARLGGMVCTESGTTIPVSGRKIPAGRWLLNGDKLVRASEGLTKYVEDAL